MTRSRRLVAAGVLSAILAAIAIWLVLHNPTVDDTSLGDGYPCSAPYDTVLNDADNVPGGEPPADADEVEARCVDVGQARFGQGLVAGAAAVLLAAVTAVPAMRGRST
ncbi:MAG: hypothetical protein ACJ72A_02335 [Nocardioidaceae bacterium]